MAEQYKVAPLSPLRRIIAARMSEAKQLIPHFRVMANLELDSLLAARQEVNAANAGATRISLNDCLIRACATALVDSPLNIQLVNNEVRRYRDVDICVVVAVEGGLSAPVVRQANLKTVRDIAAEVRDLSARAQRGQLRMSDIAGGSFTISNLGGHGVEQFDAIINPPQCAILAVGCVKRVVAVNAQGEQYIASLARVTLSLDHRALDGVAGANFLANFQRIVSSPQPLLA